MVGNSRIEENGNSPDFALINQTYNEISQIIVQNNDMENISISRISNKSS